MGYEERKHEKCLFFFSRKSHHLPEEERERMYCCSRRKLFVQQDVSHREEHRRLNQESLADNFPEISQLNDEINEKLERTNHFDVNNESSLLHQ